MPFHGSIPSTDAARLHPPAVVSESDPGAIGAGKMWIKESTGEAKIRDSTDTGWVDIAGGATSAADPHTLNLLLGVI